jgi:hypothetical protein
MKKSRVVGFAVFVLIAASCDGGKVTRIAKAPADPDSISPEVLKSLKDTRIFFGHQSVGWNIIEGVNDIAAAKGVEGFDFIETRAPRSESGFYHAVIGQNGDPLGKVADFEAIMHSGAGSNIDIAMMKFCYVDFSPATDVEAVFTAYRETMQRLETEYPKTIFVRATVPLETCESGVKAFAKRMLGRPTRGDSNAVRERMNAMIRRECRERDLPLYDLALIESTAPDGVRIERTSRRGPYYSLAEEYTKDGGHLNERGRLSAAIEFLRTAADALD